MKSKLINYKASSSKTLALLLLLTLLVSLFPIPPGSFADIDSNNAVDVKSGESDTLPSNMAEGEVWTGKTVNSGNATDDIFNVELQALGKAFQVESSDAKPVNVVLVLDASTSMDDKASGSTKSKLTLMIEAANDLIATILAPGNPGNKVGVVTFNSAATVVTNTTANPSGLSNSVFTMYSGSGPGDYKINTVAATNIQSGMNAGYKVLKDAKTAGDTAMPFMVVLSDGATWYYNSNYKSIPQSNWQQDSNGYNGNGTSNNNGITSAAYTILQGRYLKDQMAELEIFTIGFGTSNNKLTTATLNPTAANINAVTGTGNASNRLYNRLGALSSPSVTFADAAAASAALNYTDGYFASNESLEDLKEAFDQILTIINSYGPLAAGSTVTIKDTVSDDFKITGSMTMTLKSGTYNLTKSGSNYVGTGVPAGVTVTLSGTELTWTFPASELPYIEGTNNPGPAKLSFNADLKPGAAAGTFYYTNYNDGTAYNNRDSAAGANASFKPDTTNPHYYKSDGSPKPGLVGGDGVSTKPMKNTGKIKLKSIVGSLTIKKNVVAFDGSNKGPVTGFNFNINIPGFNGVGNILNADSTPDGTFNISSGSGQVTLKDGQSAVVPAVPTGKSYTVSEVDYTGSGYVTTVPGNASGSISQLANPVVFTNTYYPSAQIQINKIIQTIYDTGVNIPNGVKFPFGLYTDQNLGSKIAGIAADVTTSSGGNTYNATMNVKIKTLNDLGLFGSGNSVTLYIREEAPTGAGAGWIFDNNFYPVTINKNGNVSYGGNNNNVLVENSFEPTSGLTVNKALDGGDAGKTFSFAIKIDAPANYSYSYTMTVAGGSPETLTGTGIRTENVNLKGGESVVITGIPVGAEYTVTESDYSTSGYYSSLAGNTVSGTISESKIINVTNTFKVKTLTVSKAVVGITNPGTFDFTVSYGQTVESFSLGNGESKQITIPVGAAVTVKETNGSGYKTTVRKDGGTDVDYNANGFGFTMEDSDTQLLFTNTFKEGQLTVSKAVTGPAAQGETYKIRVTFSGSNLGEIKAKVGSEDIDAVSAGVFEVMLGAGESALFTDIPEGVTYQVVEIDQGSADSVGYAHSDGQKIINDGDKDTVTVTNTFDTPSALTISKVVPSTGYDKGYDGRFGFSIRFYSEVPGTQGETEDYELKSHELPEAPAGSSFLKVAGEGYVYYTFSLAADESIVFGDLPVGIKFIVAEITDGGARSSSVLVDDVPSDGLTVEGVVSGNANDPINVTYTNNFNMDTGELLLTKLVTGDKNIAPDSFRFTVKFTGQTDITSDGNTGIVAGNSIEFTVDLNDGGTVAFKGVKAGTDYLITEITGADSGGFDPADSGSFQAKGWKVENVSVTSTNHYRLPEITTIKDAFKGEVLISGEDEDGNAVPIGGVYTGEEVTYVVEVKNTGTKTVRLDKIEDSLFALIEEDAVSAAGPEGETLAFTLDKTGESKFLILTGGVDLAPGKSVKVTYNYSYGSAGEKINNATAYATYFYSYNPGDDNSKEIDSSDDAKIKVFNPSEVKIDKKVAAGETGFGESVEVAFKDFVTFKLTVTNSGEADLHNAAITDYQMTEENLISVILNGNPLSDAGETPDYVLEDHVLKLNDTFRSGDVLVILYGLQALESHTNTAIVKAFDGLEELEEEDDADVEVDFPSIDVTKEGNKASVLTGETVEYTITIENTFDRTLDLISVTDTFFRAVEDAGYIVSDIKYSVDAGVAVDVNQDMIDPLTGTISFGVPGEEGMTYPKFDEKAVVTYVVTFNEAGGYENNATATAGYRGAPAEDGDDWYVKAKDPTGLSVTKLANGVKSAAINRGSEVTYTVKVENTGKAALNLSFLQDPMFAQSGIEITKLVLVEGSDETNLGWHIDEDILYIENCPEPQVSTFVMTEPGDGDGDFEECEWLYFKPGMSVELTYKISMSADYTNTVVATGYEEDETPVIDDDSASVSIRTKGKDRDPDPEDPEKPEDPETPVIPEDDDSGILGEQEKDDPGVAGESDKLPQTGGVSASTILGIFGVLMVTGGGTAFLGLRRRRLAKDNNIR